MSKSSATDLVASVIQRVYNDASQTVLDRQAASEIVTALQEAGWASLDDVGRLIDAAGGEIVVPGEILHDVRDRQVTRQDDYASGGVKFRVSVSA
jgi:hypothetical protein